MDRMEMGRLLKRLVNELYGGELLPAGQGGWFFHAVCDERRRAGDLFWTEGRLHTLARELGLWPWSMSQIEAAIGKPIIPHPDDEDEEPEPQPPFLHSSVRTAARAGGTS